MEKQEEIRGMGKIMENCGRIMGTHMGQLWENNANIWGNHGNIMGQIVCDLMG